MSASTNVGGRHFWEALTAEVDERLRLERHAREMANDLYQVRVRGPRCLGSRTPGLLREEVLWAGMELGATRNSLQMCRNDYADCLRVIRNLRRLVAFLLVGLVVIGVADLVLLFLKFGGAA